MYRSTDRAQFVLRLFLGVGFILPVLDRIGWLGAQGVNGNAWGNWQNFVAYTNSLMPYLNESMSSVMGAIATVLEIIFGIGLIIGFKTKLMATGSGILTLIFALSMLFFADYRAPFTYSVFVVSGASFLIASLPSHKWSLDKK